MNLPVDVQLQPTHLLLQLTDHIQNRLQEGRERRRKALGVSQRSDMELLRREQKDGRRHTAVAVRDHTLSSQEPKDVAFP